MEIGEFHHTDGWYFKRLDEEGYVRIQVRTNDLVTGPRTITHVIPPAEWASIVAHVARVDAGGEAAAYTDATRLHVGSVVVPA